MPEDQKSEEAEKSSNSRGKALGLVTAALAALAAAAAALGNYEKIYNFVLPPQSAAIQIGFLEKSMVRSTTEMQPTWSDYSMSGYSEPLKLPLAVRNNGGTIAENVAIRFVHSNPFALYVGGDGELTPAGLLSEVASITGAETVTEFNIPRLAPSKVYEVLDENLSISFRLRERVGIPYIYKNVALIAPFWVDFHHGAADQSGSFPIDYVISMDGAEDVSGKLFASIEPETNRQIQSIPKGGSITLELVDDADPPSLDEPETVSERSISFFEGSYNELMELYLDDDSFSRVDGVALSVREFESASDKWIEIVIPEGDLTFLVDRGKNGSLDEVFVGFKFPDRTEWVLMRPAVTAPFTGIERTVDISMDMDIIDQAAQVLVDGPFNDHAKKP